MSNPGSRWQIIQALLAVVGTGLAFAFLQAGAFHDFGIDTLRRMLTPEGLRAAVLLAPVLLWQWWRNRRRAA